jgi:dTDP-4-amino-4,6-dideoxygalactose transaminase
MNPLVTSLAPLPLSIWIQPRSARLPFPLDEPTCRLFSRGRHALWQGARASGLAPGDEVLAPAYHHGSEIEALARLGLRCRFYEATETLEPDENELRRLLGPRTRALHLTHHLGFPQDAARWRRWCDEHGLLLIEDAAQSWLATRAGRPVGSFGDMAIFCLYKTFGFPDGAALHSRVPLPQPAADGSIAVKAIAFDHALWLTTRSAILSRVAERVYRQRRYVPEEDFALGDPGRAPSMATLAAIPRAVRVDAAGRRRANFARLLPALGDLAPSAFRRMPEGASPFVFPIATDGKPSMLRRLRARGIRAIDLWSTPHPSLPSEDFPGAAALRSRVIGLPVHQEMRDQDPAWVIRAWQESRSS